VIEEFGRVGGAVYSLEAFDDFRTNADAYDNPHQKSSGASEV
jgi:hypothetical protein